MDTTVRADASSGAPRPVGDLVAADGEGLQVLVVPGIATWPGRLNGWRRTLATELPGAQVQVLDGAVYWPWSRRTHRSVSAAGARALEQGRPTWILAHSFGGLLARAMLLYAPGHRVRLLTTLASPHRLRLPGLGSVVPDPARGAPTPVRALSYGGYLDPLVAFMLTPLPGGVHANLWCDHVGFLYRRSVRERVVADARAALAEN